MISNTLAVLLLAAASADAPFADLDYATALVRAKEQHTLLFVDFTASWCQPCKKMEVDTWKKREVMTWLGEHALAIQVDVDEEAELAKEFRIKAMPTVVVVRDGEEFDRIVGYRNAESFLSWARDVALGKGSSDALLERAKALEGSEDVDARYALARDLMNGEQYDLALDQFLWLWPATRTRPAMAGVRLSFMLSTMADLAREHPPAKEAFEGLLAELQTQVDAEGVPEFLTWQEWSSMCEYFGQKTRIVAWYEGRRNAAGRLFPERSEDFLVQIIVEKLFDVLMTEQRPRDAVRLIGEPRTHAARLIARFEQQRQSSRLLDDELRKTIEQFARERLVDTLSGIYAALLSAGREEKAAEVGDLLIAAVDTSETRVALVEAGLAKARGANGSLVRWLNEAEAAGAKVESLRRRLDRLRSAERRSAED